MVEGEDAVQVNNDPIPVYKNEPLGSGKSPKNSDNNNLTTTAKKTLGGSNSSSNGSNSSSSKTLSTITTTKRTKEKRIRPIGLFEDIGHISSDIINDVQYSNEGFDLNISQQICDDTKIGQMEEGGSYFYMRHMLNYPGPLTTLMSGPDCYGYRVSADAIKKDKYAISGVWGQNSVEGAWEHTWLTSNTALIKSSVSFISGFKSQQQQQMEMMMGGGPRYPSAVAAVDCKFPRHAWRMKLDMINNELSTSVNRKIIDQLTLGAKIGTSYDSRKSWMEFGGIYEFGETKIPTKPYQHSIEALWRKDTSLLQLFYTNAVSPYFSLTSRLLWQMGTTDKVQSSIGYKFHFGNSSSAKTIVGEIGSDGRVCQSIALPLLPTMLLRCYGEMNHWTTPEMMQRGMVPHKFGVQINIHI